jgi:Zn-dependent protease/CBS domain-containing protein
MMKGTFRLGRVAGIPIGLHWSWLFFFLLITWSLGVSFPHTFAGVDGSSAWAAAVVTSVLFLLSVLGHELAHALVALARGVPVRGITVFILGGVAEIEQDAERPLDEFLITVVGPLSSLAIGLGFGGVAWASRDVPVLYAVSATMAAVNLSLALFNLLPGFPLDGGRIFRALVWGWTRDFVRASRLAARVGQLIGWGMVLLGLAQTFLWQQGLGGLWTAGIGWFLSSMAQSSYQHAVLLQTLRDVRVDRVMRDRFAWVYSGTQVQDAVAQYFGHTPRPGLPVVRDGALVGLLTLPQVRALDPARWFGTPVDALMTPLARVPTVAPGDTAVQLLQAMQRRQTGEVPVVQEGRLVGLVTEDDLLHFVESQERRARGQAVATP